MLHFQFEPCADELHAQAHLRQTRAEGCGGVNAVRRQRERFHNVTKQKGTSSLLFDDSLRLWFRSGLLWLFRIPLVKSLRPFCYKRARLQRGFPDRCLSSLPVSLASRPTPLGHGLHDHVMLKSSLSVDSPKDNCFMGSWSDAIWVATLWYHRWNIDVSFALALSFLFGNCSKRIPSQTIGKKLDWRPNVETQNLATLMSPKTEKPEIWFTAIIEKQVHQKIWRDILRTFRGIYH